MARVANKSRDELFIVIPPKIEASLYERKMAGVLLPLAVSFVHYVVLRFLVPASPCRGVLFVIAQDCEHLLWMEMGAGGDDGIDRSHWRDVRACEDGAGDGGHDVAVTAFRQRSRI